MNWRTIEQFLKGAAFLGLTLLYAFAMIDRLMPWFPSTYVIWPVLIILGFGYGTAFQNERQAAGGDSRGTEPTPPHVSQRG